MTILVTLQLLMSLGVANLVSRKDQPPPWLVTPLYGILGKVLCLSNLPLFGQVQSSWSTEAVPPATYNHDSLLLDPESPELHGGRGGVANRSHRRHHTRERERGEAP